jgi:ribonuclease P protein component
LRPNALPKRLILKKISEFNEVFQQGQFLKNEYFSISFVGKDNLKVGFAAPKNSGNKPTRNKLKRIGRELWRTNFRNYDLPAHIVIITRKKILMAKQHVREQSINQLLREIEIRLSKES